MSGVIPLGRAKRETGRLRCLVLASKAHGLAPGQRFRFEQWAPHLARDHHIDLDLLPFESPALAEILYRPGQIVRKAALTSYDFIRRARAIAIAAEYDAVLVFREAALLGPALYERMIVRRGIPLIFDFDDSIWSPAQEQANGIFSRLHSYGKFKTICRLARAVTPGNEFLAAYARAYNPAVHVLPTSIELDEYPVQPPLPADDPFTICWTGSTSTLAHFEHAREALEIVASQIPVRVRVICNSPPKRDIAGAETVFVPWSAKNEAVEIGACHIGIMPLPDDEVTRGKCGLKALQYMATGRPAVVSPVGMNSDLVQHRVNGLLASTVDEWVAGLLEMSEASSNRTAMGERARASVEAGYSAEAVAAMFAKVLKSSVAGGAHDPLRPQATQ
jgi:glycosyltransferase involved in cell wall biosynthesis